MQQVTWSVENTPGKAFKYWWAKNVQGFRSEVHCARCLIGGYESGFKATAMGGVLRGRVGDTLYLCGVSQAFSMANNYHRALEVTLDPSDVVTDQLYGRAGLITIIGARVIAFDGAAAKERFPSLGPAFLTCRNFQFGAQHYA